VATFEETVLALNPLLFWRCKDLAGTQITDYSGNGFHGDVVSANVILGQPSAVETDPDARSVYSTGTSVFFANNIAEIDEPPPELLFTGDFTIACFVRHQQQSGFQYLFARGGIAGSVVDGLQFLTTGNTTRTLACWFVTDDGVDLHQVQVTAEVPHLNDADYFAVVKRVGATVTLSLNTVIVGQDTGADTNPLEVDASNRLVFGAGGNNLGPAKGWLSELIICDYGWTAAEELAVYESALNSLFLNLVSNVIPSAVISSDFPTEPISFPFRWNWAEPPIERLTFRTDVSRARTGAEEGNGQRVTPRREFEFQQVLRNNVERRRLRALLWGKQHAIWFVPVRQDAEQLTAPLLTGVTTIPVTTAYKDYEVGGYIGLRQYDDSGNITHWEEQLITAITPVSVESGALTNDYDPYLSWVYPVKRALLTPSVSPQGITDAVETITLTARLLPEDEAEVPHRLTVWSPTLKYRDYEVFDPAVWPSHNWDEEREYEVERVLDEIDFDTGRISYDADTIGAAEATPYSVILSSRAVIAQFLGWFYERKGQLRYLWVPTMQSDFEVLSVDGAELTVADTSYSDAFALAEPRRDLAFVYYDNSMEFRRVLSFSGTPDETLVLDAAVPTLTNLRSISLLKFSRLDADQLELVWETDSIVRVAWRFRELLHSPEGEGVSSLSPSHSASVSLSASHSPSPSASESPSPSASVSSSPSPSISVSISPSPSASVSQSASVSPSSSPSASPSPSASTSPSASESPSISPSASPSPSV
jgi:hypothetical protein